MSAPQVGTFSFSGLDAFGADPLAVFSKLKEWLLPSVSELSGRPAGRVREEIRGPVIHPTSRLESECHFDGDGGLACEVVVYEGMFLALRCFAEIVASQMQIEQQHVPPAMPREKAVELLEAVLERFWLKPEDPLGFSSFDFLDKSRMLQPGYVRPIADIMPTLDHALSGSPRREWAQALIQSSAMFVLAHELAHYVVRSRGDDGSRAQWADAVRAIGFREPPDAPRDWAVQWAEEFQSDVEASTILMHFGQRAAGGEIEAIKPAGNRDQFIVGWSMSTYSGMFFTLGTLHLLETYGWARLQNPFPSVSHPPSRNRRELLTQLLPSMAAVLTVHGDLVWNELEALFSEVLERQVRKNGLRLKGRDRTEMLEYFAAARKRRES
jgi:hypothetical protein